MLARGSRGDTGQRHGSGQRRRQPERRQDATRDRRAPRLRGTPAPSAAIRRLPEPSPSPRRRAGRERCRGAPRAHVSGVGLHQPPLRAVGVRSAGTEGDGEAPRDEPASRPDDEGREPSPPPRAPRRRRRPRRASGRARSPSSWPGSRARSWARWPRRTAPSRRPSRARSTSARRAPTSSATSRAGSRASSGWRGSSSRRASCARRTSTRRPSWRSRSTPCSSRRRSCGGWSSTTTGRQHRPDHAGAAGGRPRPPPGRCSGRAGGARAAGLRGPQASGAGVARRRGAQAPRGAPTRKRENAQRRRPSARRTTGNPSWSPVSGGAGTGSPSMNDWLRPAAGTLSRWPQRPSEGHPRQEPDMSVLSADDRPDRGGPAYPGGRRPRDHHGHHREELRPLHLRPRPHDPQAAPPARSSTGSPSAYFVNGDTGLKQTSDAKWDNLFLNAEELAVLVPIPDTVYDDADYDLWTLLKPQITEAMGAKVDDAVLFGTGKPTLWPDGILVAATAAGNIVTGAVALGHPRHLRRPERRADPGGDGRVRARRLAAPRQTMRGMLRNARDGNRGFLYPDAGPGQQRGPERAVGRARCGTSRPRSARWACPASPPAPPTPSPSPSTPRMFKIAVRDDINDAGVRPGRHLRRRRAWCCSTSCSRTPRCCG